MRETLYLVPGLLCDAAVWAPQIAAFQADYDVRVPDLTSFSSIAAMAESVLADAPRRFSIVGHSMGARVALEVVRLAPLRVDRLALLDTGVDPLSPGEAEKRQALLEISAGSGMRALADRWLPPMVMSANFGEGSELRRTLYAMVERMTPAIHRGQISALLSRPDANEVLPLIRCPALVGVGDSDAWSPPDQHRTIAAAIQQVRLVIFPESGHMAPLEAPGAVTEALATWLRDAPL